MPIRTETPASVAHGPGVAQTNARSYFWLGTLVLGYIGVYLCRKNLAVAIPMLQADLGVTREQIGTVASASTIAYAAGNSWARDRSFGRPVLLLHLAPAGGGVWRGGRHGRHLAHAHGLVQQQSPGWFSGLGDP